MPPDNADQESPPSGDASAPAGAAPAVPESNAADPTGVDATGVDPTGVDSTGVDVTGAEPDRSGPHGAATDGAGGPPAVAGPADPAADKAAARRLTVIGVAAVLLVAGAVLLGLANHAARADGPLSNQAFVDTGSTSAVVGDVTAAIKVVYSYDYKTLDANQAAAKSVVTGKFAEEFDKVFAALRQLAPQQQAVLTTTVPAVGVTQVQGDRAQLLMMVDQNGTRMGSQPIAGTSARLVVQAQLVDGHWRISEVTPE